MTLLQPIALDSATGSERPAANMLRLLIGSLIGPIPQQPGVVGAASLKVSQHSTPNMSVDIAAGPVFAAQSEGPQQGLFFTFNDAVATVAFGASNPTNPRIDCIIVAFRDSSISGGNDDAIFAVVPGTPAGSPVAPNPTTAGYKNYEILAQVRVDANATSILNAKITDVRKRTGGQSITVGCSSLAPSALYVNGNDTAIPFSSADVYDTAAIHDAAGSPTLFTIPTGYSGLWQFDCTAFWDISLTGGPIKLSLHKNGAAIRSLFQAYGSTDVTAKTSMVGHTSEPAVAGDVFSLFAYQVSGGQHALTEAHAMLEYRGPLS